VYLPAGAVPMVRVGQTMIGGETVVAALGAAPVVVVPPVILA
jgi:hypothetical protein